MCMLLNVNVLVFQRSILNWRRGTVSLPWVDVHSSIYEMYSVYWFSRDLCSIGGEGRGSVCHGYMYILLYIKCLHCSGFAEIYAQLEGGTSAFSICAFFYMSNLFGVVPWVYVHYFICQTKVV